MERETEARQSLRRAGSVGLIVFGLATVLTAFWTPWRKGEAEVVTMCLGENVTISDYAAEIDSYRRSFTENILNGRAGELYVPSFFVAEKGGKPIPWPTAERLGIIDWALYRERRRHKKSADPDVLCWRQPEMSNGYFCRGEVLSELHRGLINIEVRPELATLGVARDQRLPH